MKDFKRPLIYIALQLIFVASLQLLFASSAFAQISGNTILFNPAPYGGWQTGCHYPNPPVLNPAAGSPRDLAVIQLTGANHNCGATCANTLNCSHFVKTTDGSHGACYLKSGPVPPAVAGNPNYYVCGYVTRPKGCLGIRCPG